MVLHANSNNDHDTAPAMRGVAMRCISKSDWLIALQLKLHWIVMWKRSMTKTFGWRDDSFTVIAMSLLSLWSCINWCAVGTRPSEFLVTLVALAIAAKDASIFLLETSSNDMKDEFWKILDEGCISELLLLQYCKGGHLLWLLLSLHAGTWYSFVCSCSFLGSLSDPSAWRASIVSKHSDIRQSPRSDWDPISLLDKLSDCREEGW